MKSSIIKAVCEEIVEAVRGRIDAIARGVDEVRAQLRDIPAGPPGIGIKSIAQAADLSSADIELDNGQVIELQLPAGPKGDRGEPGPEGEPGDTGAPGHDGQAPSADEVAAVLCASPEFVAAATPDLFRAPAWQAGIHRAGSFVAHFMGRLYCAEKDTTAEPGDSPDWRRIGTQGWRHTGGWSDTRSYEAGDLCAKGGSTFMFDGTKLWLMAPRPYTVEDANKGLKETAKSFAELRAEIAALSRAVETLMQRGAP